MKKCSALVQYRGHTKSQKSNLFRLYVTEDGAFLFILFIHLLIIIIIIIIITVIIMMIMMIIIAFKGAIRDFFKISSLRRELSPTHTLNWPWRNHVQITGNTTSTYHVQLTYLIT